jgi:Baseplate J-like protein
VVGGVIYLDSDDEITSAAARIRSVEGRRVAVVLPYGSRVATSRINFRLLARDAMTHEKRLSIIAADAATRALAASAGLPAFATVAEYESSLGSEGAIADRPLERSATIVTGPDPDDRPPAVAGTSAGVAGAAAVATSGGRVRDPDVAPATDAGDTSAITRDRRSATATATVAAASVPARSAAPPRESVAASVVVAPDARTPARARPDAGGEGRGIGRTPIIVGLAVLALAIVVGGVAAFLVLPSATAVVTPREETIGPVSLRISASTEIDEPDMEAGLVPAQVVSIEVQADDTFPATGKRVAEKKARGVVRFQNLDFTSSNTVAKGAIVRTSNGIRFRTDKAVTVPAAKLVGVTIFASEKNVKVTAVEAGPEGNVPAGAIQVPPPGEAFLNVTNPNATTGGTRDEFPRVTQADVDAAQATLSSTLTTSFQDRLDDPDLVAEGITVFPETAALGTPAFSDDADTLVGQEVESFDLGASATGTVTTVDSAPVRVIAEARLDASVDPGHQLVDGSSRIDEAPAVVEGATITYPVVATARQVAILDPAEIKAAILGKPLADAQAILDGFGEASLQTWPDWVSTIPTIESRVDVSVQGPLAVETPNASAGPSPSEAPGSTP